LQKVLARCGLASRRDAEVWIRAGRLTVNGAVATLGARVTPSDQVRLDGRLVRGHALTPAARVYVCHRSPAIRSPRPRPSQRSSPRAPACWHGCRVAPDGVSSR
jgi:23S rRNA pseudouridine2605 synthase